MKNSEIKLDMEEINNVINNLKLELLEKEEELYELLQIINDGQEEDEDL